jgi:hypothetical protein
VPLPPLDRSTGQQLDQVAVSPDLQKAGQGDCRADDVTAGWLLDSYPPDHPAQPLRVFLHELGIDGDLAPSFLYGSEILYAVVHDRLE